MRAPLLLSLCLIGCGGTPTPVAPQPAAQPAPVAAPPARQPTAAFKLPPHEKIVLDSGLTLYLMPHTEVPLIHVSVAVDAGAVHDAHSRAGLASMTAEGLLFGAGSYTKKAIEETTDFHGAHIGAWAGLEAAGLTAAFLKSDADTFFPIIHALLTAPKFPKAEVAKYRTRLVSQLAQSRESPRAVVGDYFRKLVYGGHAYGNASNGTAKTVKTLQSKHLKAFHTARYHPKAMAIAVVGDFDAPAMATRLKAQFGGWTQDGKVGAVSKPTWPKAARVLLVDKPDARETTFVIGGPGIRRDDPDYVAIEVINTILGARFTSWLNDALRVDSGLTYGARSNFADRRAGGTFAISTFTKTATTFEAIDLALKTYERLWKTGIDAKTLESAKAYVKGQFPPGYETAGQLAELLTDMHVYGFDAQFINTFQAKIDALTTEKAAEIVERVFPKAKLQFVLIGVADALRDKAKAYGEITETRIETPDF